MKYKAYFSDSLESLVNEEFIFEADTAQKVTSYIAKLPITRGGYWRWMFFDFGAAIDYGSWSRFIIITNAKYEDII